MLRVGVALRLPVGEAGVECSIDRDGETDPFIKFKMWSDTT